MTSLINEFFLIKVLYFLNIYHHHLNRGHFLALLCVRRALTSLCIKVLIGIYLFLTGASSQNGNALRRELSSSSYSSKRNTMTSPSESSLSSGGGMDAGDTPQYDREVSDSMDVYMRAFHKHMISHAGHFQLNVTTDKNSCHPTKKK